MLQRRGNLLTALLGIALIATIGFALASLTVQHLAATTTQAQREIAQNLARSAVSRGIERLMANPSLGAGFSGPSPRVSAPSAADLVSVQLAGAPPDAVGLLTFHPEVAKAQQIPCSTNNLEGTLAVLGAGRTVPVHCVQLMGEGRSGGMVARVEAIMAIPAFPYALASAGPVKAWGGVTIGALATAPTGPVGPGATLGPADICSNDLSKPAIFLGQDTLVTGDVRTPGEIQLDPNAPAGTIRVKGQIKPGASAEKLPKIPLSDYDPKLNGQRSLDVPPVLTGAPAVLGGVVRHQGNLLAPNGLKLDGSLVYIDGDLRIGTGGIAGKGILVVTGNVSVNGQSDLVSGNGVALLVGKDLSLQGGGSTGSYFQGLVYTEGCFAADKVTVVGTLIAAGQNTPPITLHETRLIESPAVVNVTTPPPTYVPWNATVPLQKQASGATSLGSPSLGNPKALGTGSGRIGGGDPATILADAGGMPNPMPPTTRGPWTGSKAWTGTNALAKIVLNRDGTLDLNLDFGATGGQKAHKLNRLPRSKMVTQLKDYLTKNDVDAADADLILSYLTANMQTEPPPTEPEPPPPPVVTTVDPSAFLKLQERVRVTLWKEN